MAIGNFHECMCHLTAYVMITIAHMGAHHTDIPASYSLTTVRIKTKQIPHLHSHSKIS